MFLPLQVKSVADLVHEAEQLALLEPWDRPVSQTQVHGSNASAVLLEDIGRLDQSKRSVDKDVVSVNDQLNA